MYYPHFVDLIVLLRSPSGSYHLLRSSVFDNFSVIAFVIIPFWYALIQILIARKSAGTKVWEIVPAFSFARLKSKIRSRGQHLGRYIFDALFVFNAG